MGSYRKLPELTVGIIGLEIARVCKALGMDTIGLTRTERAEEDKEAWVDQYVVRKIAIEMATSFLNFLSKMQR